MTTRNKCEEFGKFPNSSKCYGCNVKVDCIENTKTNFLPNAYLYGGSAGLIAIITALANLKNIIDLAAWMPSAITATISMVIIYLLYKNNRIRYFDLFHNLCTNGKSCKNIKFNVSEELKSELHEFQTILLKNHDLIVSRTEYIENAMQFRDREICSIHVMYLTKNSLDVYSHEIKDWVDSERQDKTKNNRRRLVVISQDAKDNMDKLIYLLKRLEKSSEIKIINENVLENDVNYKKLLKDFGIFIVKQKDITSKYGFFTVANVTKLNHAKHIFSMLTDEFYIIQNNDFINKYSQLFENAWNDNNIMFFNVSSFIENYANAEQLHSPDGESQGVITEKFIGAAGDA